MAESADAEDGDQIAGTGSAVAKSVEGGDAGAHEGAASVDASSSGTARNGCGGDHVVGVSAVAVTPVIIVEVWQAKKFPRRQLSQYPQYPPFQPRRRAVRASSAGTCAHRVDHPDDFVSGDARILDAGEEAVLRYGRYGRLPQACTLIRTKPGPGVGDFTFDNFQGTASTGTWTARTFGMIPPLTILP